jgi:hypothetical protein
VTTEPTAPTAPADKTLAGSDGVRRTSALPSHFPPWAGKLAELYFSGTTSMFVLHGNVFDLVRLGPADAADTRWGGLAEFLAEQLFGRWDLCSSTTIWPAASAAWPAPTPSGWPTWSRRSTGCWATSASSSAIR